MPDNTRRDRFVTDVLHGGDKSVGATLARAGLAGLAGLHRIGLETYLLPYNTGVRRRYRLPVPVVAIGNLSSGGTGKTPMAALVARNLHNAGKRVALLSRGHGGSGESGYSSRIVSDGQRILLGPEEAGDEPVLLARLLPGVPVVVGRDRRRSGRLALSFFRPEVLVCDDALQYWQLHRDLDIVLLDARHPFDNGYVLPRGLLREPPSHLSRAGVVVLTRADRVPQNELAATVARVQKLAPRAEVLTARHAPLGWVPESDGSILAVSALEGLPVLAFSGIADGDAFAQTVQNLGANVVVRRDFGDHHAYTPGDIAELTRDAQAPNIRAAVTTEKDLVKAALLWPPTAPPLYALRIGMCVENEARLWQRLQTVFEANALLAPQNGE